MTKVKTYKIRCTELVLSEISKNHPYYLEYTLDQLLFKWWFTGRQDGLRLTDAGMEAFTFAKIEEYDVSLGNSRKGKSDYEFVLLLSKKMKCPYYLGINKSIRMPYLRLYDSRIAMLVGIYGDIADYLDSVRIR